MEQLSTSNNEQERRRPTPQIYVASLSDYNNARLHGVWIDATDEPADIHTAIAAMLSRSPDPGAEEYAIHDYSDFPGFAVGEYDVIEAVHKIACGIAEHGEAFGCYVGLVGTEEASESGFTDIYCGTYPTLRAFVEQFVDDIGVADGQLDHLRGRTGLGQFLEIDYDGLEIAIRSEWNITEGQQGVHIFAP